MMPNEDETNSILSSDDDSPHIHSANAISGIDKLDAVYDIPVTVSFILGKSTIQIYRLLKLGRGAVVELDREVGEAIGIFVNNRLIGRGEVVVVDDRLALTITEIIKSDME